MPRTRLPEVLRRIAELAREYGLRVANVFHAGDGNLHPLVLYDDAVDGRGRARRAARDRDPRRLHRRGRLAHRRARRRRRQGVLDAEALRRARPRGDAAAAGRLRPRRAREPRQGLPDAAPLRRGARARTARTRWSGQALPSVSEPATLEEAARGARRPGRASRSSATAARSCSRRRGLNRVLEHEPGDLTAIVEAGIRLSELQAHLARARADARARPARRPDDRRLPRRRPLRPAAPPLRRDARPRDRRHRRPRRAGSIASSGGKVVKNVAGYDLGKLFSGSRGRLGLIARVALRLHPRPAAEATVVAETDDPRALWQRAPRARSSSRAPSTSCRRAGSRCSSRGRRPRSRRRSAACPGEPADDGGLGRERRGAAGAGGRAPFDWQDCLLARPGPGHRLRRRGRAARAWSPLAERVRASFDPEGILV